MARQGPTIKNKDKKALPSAFPIEDDQPQRGRKAFVSRVHASVPLAAATAVVITTWFVFPGRMEPYAQLGAIFGLVFLALSQIRKLTLQLVSLNDKYKRRLAELEQAATRDDLTAVANRRSFYEQLRKNLESARRRRRPLGLLLLDLDDLKLINDRHGHQAGDVVLNYFASLLNQLARSQDTVGRLGGDEFAISMPGSDSRDLESVCARIWQALAQNPVRVSRDLSISLSVSIGSSCFPANGDDVESLVYWADSNLYSNKLARKGIIKRRMSQDNKLLVTSVVKVLTATMNVRDGGLHNHARRVGHLAAAIAREMGLSDEEIWVIQQGASLHDIGKVGLADKLLNKPAALSAIEWKEMRRHPELGFQILNGIGGMDKIAAIVYTHHERFDGSGYPGGLVAEEIPIGARVFAVADAYDAMTNRRPYRAAISREGALGEIALHAGTQFDPRVVAAFLRLMGGLENYIRDEIQLHDQLDPLLSVPVLANFNS
ncbi:MAG TPA: diguanylate cyclase [Dehalococcoidia bacterium]|nr:diguanylate cyclase [Dehalococcoidia bacterium]